MQDQRSQPIILTRAQRDVLWVRAANDLETLGDELHHAGQRRKLADAERHAAPLRTVLELLDAIGWELHDDRDEYPVALDRGALASLLERWRSQLDRVLADQAPSGDPLTAAERETIDSDLDVRLAVDQVLEAVAR